MNSSRYANDFIELERIGKGGFGTVHKVLSKIDNQIYAIKKIVFNHSGFSPVEQRKIFREVRCLAKLNDRNIVRYYNAWVETVWEKSNNNYKHINNHTNTSNNNDNHNNTNISSCSDSNSISLSNIIPLPRSYVNPQAQLFTKKTPPLLQPISAEGTDNTNTNSRIDDNSELLSGSHTNNTDEPCTASISYGENTQDYNTNTKRSAPKISQIDDNSINNITNNNYSNHNDSFTELANLAAKVGVDLHAKIQTKSKSNKNKHYPNSNQQNAVENSNNSLVAFEFEDSKQKNETNEVDDSSEDDEFDNEIDTAAINHTNNTNSNNNSNVLNTPSLNSNHDVNVINDAINLPRSEYINIPPNKSQIKIEVLPTNSPNSSNHQTPNSYSLSNNYNGTINNKNVISESKSGTLESLPSAIAQQNQSNIVDNNAVGEMQQSGANNQLQRIPNIKTSLKYKLCLYIQTQYCLGQTLLQYLNQPNRLISSQVNMPILAQILSGLAHIHKQNIVHRDLKPANLFITTRSEINAHDIIQLQNSGVADLSDVFVIKLGDFGLAKSIQHLDQNEDHNHTNTITNNKAGNNTIGTITYASPEQLSGHNSNHKSDIFSAGIILFELYSKFSTQMERIQSLNNVRKGILSESFITRFPEECRLILSMCNNKPNQRPSAYELLNHPFVMQFAPKTRALQHTHAINNPHKHNFNNQLLQLTDTSKSYHTTINGKNNHNNDANHSQPNITHYHSNDDININDLKNHGTHSKLSNSKLVSSLSMVALDTLRNFNTNHGYTHNTNLNSIPSISTSSLLLKDSTNNNNEIFNDFQIDNLNNLSKPELVDKLKSAINMLQQQQLLIDTLKSKLSHCENINQQHLQ